MAHSIHVGFLGVDDFMLRMIETITQKNVITEKNVYISAASASRITKEGTQSAYSVLTDDPAVLMKSEIVVLAAPKREFGTVLAPLCALTRGKIIIAMTEGIDCAYVLERVTNGTLVAAALPTKNEDDTLTAHIEFSKGFPEYMKGACEDIINSVCQKA